MGLTPSAFIDLAELRSINVVLERRAKEGKIRKLARGLYDYPRNHPKLSVLHPEINTIVKAIIGRDNIRYKPSGAYAANMLGLSEQVPSKVVFITDGISRKIVIGKFSIEFKKTTTKNMALAGKEAGLVIQALIFLKPHNVNGTIINRLKKLLKRHDKRSIFTTLPRNNDSCTLSKLYSLLEKACLSTKRIFECVGY